jgi:hypothetical protein
VSGAQALFTGVLDAHIQRTRQTSTRTGPQPAWYASGLGYCERKATLRRAGVKGTPFDVRTLRKFWMGDKVHHELQSAIETELRSRDDVIFLGHELSIRNDEFKVAGRLDSLVSVNGVIEAWEYKSTASGSFKYADLPKKEHKLQLGVYLTFPCKMQDAEGWYDVLPQRGRLIYWSKDDALIDEYIVESTPELHEQVKETLGRLEDHYQKYLKDQTLPPVIDLEQAMKKNKKTGKYDEPFVYLRDYKKKDGTVIPKGTKKMIHNFQCISKNGTNPCEFYGNACPLSAWGLTSGPDEGEDAPEESEE